MNGCQIGTARVLLRMPDRVNCIGPLMAAVQDSDKQLECTTDSAIIGHWEPQALHDSNATRHDCNERSGNHQP
jgi:hypothetical protein